MTSKPDLTPTTDASDQPMPVVTQEQLARWAHLAMPEAYAGLKEWKRLRAAAAAAADLSSTTH